MGKAVEAETVLNSLNIKLPDKDQLATITATFGLLELEKGNTQIEKDLREEKLSEEEFVKKRRTKTSLLLRKFKKWMKEQQKVVTPENLPGKAISYTLNEYIKLVRYLKYAYITPDNNEAERAIRPFTIGRKNWLFNNTPRGAYASANLYSLIETAKANNLEPSNYLNYLFTNIPEVESKEKLEKLLPWNVKGKIPLLAAKRG